MGMHLETHSRTDALNASPASRPAAVTLPRAQAVKSAVAPSSDQVTAGVNSIKLEQTAQGQQYVVLPGGTAPTEDDRANAMPGDGGALSFTGLMSDTGYTVFTRVPGDAMHAPSEAVSVDVRTTKPAKGMRSPSVQGTTGDTVTITVRHGEQYSIDGGATWITPDESGRVVFDNGKKGDGESYGLSPAQTYEIVARRIGTAVLNPSASGAAARVTTPSRSPSARANTPMIVATTPGSITV